MDIAENYDLGFGYYDYKTLISSKIYAVLYQYSQLNSRIINYKMIIHQNLQLQKVQNFEKNASDGQFLISLIALDD